MNRTKTAKSRSAQTLIEVVLSVGLATMVLVALVILGSASVKTSTSSSRRAEASKLASSGIEAIRYLRDSGGFDNLTDGCYEISGSYVSSNVTCPWNQIAFDTGDIFERKIEVAAYPTGNTTMKKVTSTVQWLETGGTSGYKQVIISTVLSKW